VGLVQRELEAAGMTTITLSSIPDLTAAVSAPRIAAIEYPFGRTVGQPHDHEGQRTVLQATLQALTELTTPGSIRHLPFEWPEPPKKARVHPPQLPPIAQYLRTHPWQLPNLLARNVPGKHDIT
jgi:hypothetical protein